jgi:HEAT repeat protein
MAPDERGANEAYEENWYRSLRALADRRDPTAPPEDEEELGLAQIAAIEAVTALGDIGGGGAVTALLECLDDPDAPVRIRVVETLAELGDRRAVPAVRALAHDDPDPAVVLAAKAALAKLDAP